MSTKIYSWTGNPRGDICRIAADLAGVNAEFVNTPYTELKSKEFLAKHPLGKVPFLETPEGNLFETHAILKYFGRKANALGENAFEEAQVQQWLDFINSEFLPVYFPIYMDILGHAPFDANKFKENRAALYAKLRYINEYLNHHTYLAGESFSVADISLAVWIAPLFYSVLDENFRKGHFSLVRYYKHILANKSVKKFLRAPFMCQKEWFGVSAKADKPAAKEKAPKEKKAEKKVEKKVEKVEEPKKAADPLTELPPSPFVLYDFKTFIVNETDKKKGVEEFWKQYDPKGYSIWHVKYDKYEGEGVKLFLTSNMKDSFLQRLDHFRKYVFGTYGVYGEEGAYEVEGVWVWRGTEIPQQIKDLPNYEYHFWTKLDHEKEQDRALLEEFWLNMKEDEDKVKGMVARDVAYFK